MSAIPRLPFGDVVKFKISNGIEGVAYVVRS